MLRAVPLRFVCGAITSTSTPGSSAIARRSAWSPAAPIPSSFVTRTSMRKEVDRSVVREREFTDAPRSRADATITPMSASISVVVPTRDRPAALARCLAALGRAGRRRARRRRRRRRLGRPRRARAGRRGRCPARASSAGPAAGRRSPATSASAPRPATSSACSTTTAFRGPTGRGCSPRPAAPAGRPPGRRVAPPRRRSGRRRLAGDHQPPARRVGRIGRPAPSASRRAATSRRREPLFASLPFDESFPSAAGEDRDWCERLRERGVAIAYVPDGDRRPPPGARARRVRPPAVPLWRGCGEVPLARARTARSPGRGSTPA